MIATNQKANPAPEMTPPAITLRDAPGSSMCIVIAGRPFIRRQRSEYVIEFIDSISGDILGYWIAPEEQK